MKLSVHLFQSIRGQEVKVGFGQRLDRLDQTLVLEVNSLDMVSQPEKNLKKIFNMSDNNIFVNIIAVLILLKAIIHYKTIFECTALI